MTDEEIDIEAKKYSQGNFYVEQGFSYGYEVGLAEGRKEICKICEKKMIEGNSNIGCAYRKLGNEYCWENEK